MAFAAEIVMVTEKESWHGLERYCVGKPPFVSGRRFRCSRRLVIGREKCDMTYH